MPTARNEQIADAIHGAITALRGLADAIGPDPALEGIPVYDNALDADLFLLNLSKADVVTIRNALRHLATIANDALVAYRGDVILDNPEWRSLNEATDQAYEALGWARYGAERA